MHFNAVSGVQLCSLFIDPVQDPAQKLTVVLFWSVLRNRVTHLAESFQMARTSCLIELLNSIYSCVAYAISWNFIICSACKVLRAIQCLLQKEPFLACLNMFARISALEVKTPYETLPPPPTPYPPSSRKWPKLMLMKCGTSWNSQF